MYFKPGSLVWIPCEVKPGPFSNERVVRIRTTEGYWEGFVETRFLQDPLEAGETQIRAKVEGARGRFLRVLLPGHAMAAPKLVEREQDTVTLAAVPA